LHDGTALYVAGNFTAINGTPANGVARWDGSKWESLGTGIRVTSDDVGNRLLEVRALGFLGADLYATGVFRQSGEVATFNLSRWDGSKWNAVPIGFFTPRDGIGGELDPLSFASSGSAISVLGETLYAGGQFLFPGRNLGAWKEGQFIGSLLGGVDVSNFDSGSVKRLRNADNLLYVMGEFQRAGVDFGRIDANGFAIWDGAAWQKPVAEFPRFGVNDFDVQGARIAIGGAIPSLFSFVDGELISSTPVRGVGLWDGKRWGSLGRGVEQEQNPDGDSIKFVPGEVHRLQLSGRRLYVTGMFTRVGGIPANCYGVWENAP
jgi:hypothetical protein